MLLVAFAAGCTREAPPVYVASEEVAKLPQLHQQQIETTLRQYFGTPLQPRLALPGEEASPEGEEPQLTVVVPADRLAHGGEVYRARCAGCHGVTGDGAGEAAAFLQPKPRDYRRGIFKFTSTPYGAKPSRSDLLRIVRRGAKGTSMPSFRWMSDEDAQAVVDYVIHLSYRGEVEYVVAQVAAIDYDEDEEIDPAEFYDAIDRVHNSWQTSRDQIVFPITPPPLYTPESILAGRKAFLSRGCSKCHGDDGRGQTDWLSHEFLAEQESKPESERIQINFDAWGEVAPAADLTAGMLHGGRRPIDIYRRIYTGINGTPMPAFADALSEEPETIWHLVHYITSIVEGGPVRPEEDAEAAE